jgi:hypothetical protein
MKHQSSNGLPEQLSIDWEGPGGVGHGTHSDAVSGAGGQVVGQVPAAEESVRALKQDLMERVAEAANLVEALGRVCANKGSAGVDGMNVTELWSRDSGRGTGGGLRFALRLIPGEQTKEMAEGQ